jgi:hypothetical protein
MTGVGDQDKLLVRRFHRVEIRDRALGRCDYIVGALDHKESGVDLRGRIGQVGCHFVGNEALAAEHLTGLVILEFLVAF